MNSEFLNQLNKAERIKASDSAKWLLSRGIASVTTDELAALLGIPKNQVPQRMAPLKHKGELISPAEGLWIPVPPEYMTWKAPPAIEIIDAMMRHLHVDYYIGWLSAAEMHGVSHHAPQVFQVATSKPIRDRTVGRSRFRFYHRTRINQVPLIRIETRSGMVPISCKEATLLDAANDITIVGGIDNAANVIIELCEKTAPDIDVLASLSMHYPVTAIRRLGYLIEEFTDIDGLEPLKAASSASKAALSLLHAKSGHKGTINANWNLKINREVSPDV